MALAEPYPGAPSFLIGRESELEAFAQCLKRLRADDPVTRIALHGEPGLGKTRLIDAFRSCSASIGVGWVGAAVSEADRNVPYRVWRGLLSALLAGLAARWHQSVSQTVAPRAETRLLRALLEQAGDAERRRDLLPVLGDLLVTGLPETERSASLSPEGRADALAELVAALVGQSVGETGLVLAIDDAQWMDSGSWRLLDRVCARVRGLLVVLGLHTLTSASQRLLQDPGTHNRILTPLDARGIGQLLAAGMGGVRPSVELGASIARETAGFPLHAIELLRLLLDRRQIVVSDGEARLQGAQALHELAGLGRASDLRALLAARIRRLPPREREVLAAASIAHGPFTADWIGTLGGLGEDEVRDRLAACVVAAVIEPVPGSASYRFRHGYLREAVTAMIDPPVARRLHAAAAEMAEASALAGVDTVAARIAGHWEAAGAPWRAIGWLRRAGLEAMQRFAHAEAVAQFEEALRLADCGDPSLAIVEPRELALARIECLRRGGYSLLQLGDLASSRTWLMGALALSGVRVPEGQAALASGALRSAVGLGLRSLRPMKRRGESTEDDRNLAVALIRLSHVAYLRAEGGLLAFATLRCLQVVERAVPGRESAIIDAALSTGFGAVGWHRAARSRVARAIETARRIGDPGTLSQTLLFCALYEANATGGASAMSHALEAYRIARRIGDGRRAAESALVLGLVRSRSGAIDAGRRWYLAVCALARARGDAQCLSWGLLGLARDALARGRVDQARAWIEQLPQPAPDALSELERDGLLAAIMHASGLPGAMQQAASAIGGFARRRPITFGVLGGAQAAMDTLVALAADRRDSSASGRLRQEQHRRAMHALRIVERFARSVPVARPSCLIARGRLRLAQGRRRKGLAELRKALRLAEVFGLARERQMAREWIANALGERVRGT